MLIKQGKDKGLNLGAAIDAARRFREQQAAQATPPAGRSSCPARRRLRGRRLGGRRDHLRQSRARMSTGAGKTIVVESELLISMSVCR